MLWLLILIYCLRLNYDEKLTCRVKTHGVLNSKEVLEIKSPLEKKDIAGYHCLACDVVAKPEFCDTVRRCGSHEKCFVEATVSAAGIIRYRLGCMDIFQCSQSQVTGSHAIRTINISYSDDIQSRSFPYLTCSECCSGDLCNSAGCGNTGYPVPHGPICFNCPQQISPNDCGTITMCSLSQVCMLHGTRDPVTHKDIYESKCEVEQKCNEELGKVKHASVVVGKRGKRGTGDACLMKCCKTSLCNTECDTVSGSVITTPVPSTTIIDPCSSNPCQRGTCLPSGNMYTCKCDQGAHGHNCEYVDDHWYNWMPWSSCSVTCGTGLAVRYRTCTNPTTPGGKCNRPSPETEKMPCHRGNCPGCDIDIVFVVDEFRSYGFPGFREIMSFIKDIVIHLNIGTHAGQVALLLFDNHPHLQWHLNTYTSKADLLNALTNVTYHIGTTASTGEALRYVRENILQLKNGDRPTAKNIVAVITDGRSNNHTATKTEATNLLNDGVKMVALGVGNSVSTELIDIAGAYNRAVKVAGYNYLPDAVSIFLKMICSQ